MPFLTHQNRHILFIHIPKTGGTAITEWMRSIGPVQLFSRGAPRTFRTRAQHLRNIDMAELFAEDFFSYRFAIVRDPYDRIASEYRFRCARLHGNGQVVLTFSTWLDLNLQRAFENPYHLDSHLRPQVDFVGSDVEIFRYEDGLETIRRQAAKAAGLPTGAPLTRALAVGQEFGPDHWDLQDRLMVSRHFAQDFEHFGYPLITD